MKLTFDVPALTGKQKTCTGALCAAASALFILPSALTPGLDVAPVQVLGGLALPAAVALLFWSAKGALDEHDDRRRHELDVSARLGEMRVRAAERELAPRYVRLGLDDDREEARR